MNQALYFSFTGQMRKVKAKEIEWFEFSPEVGEIQLWTERGVLPSWRIWMSGHRTNQCSLRKHTLLICVPLPPRPLLLRGLIMQHLVWGPLSLRSCRAFLCSHPTLTCGISVRGLPQLCLYAELPESGYTCDFPFLSTHRVLHIIAVH